MKNKRLINFMQIVGKLKLIKRTGWVNSDIKNPESVAEHSFSLAIMTLILAPKFGADPFKALKMALIHDLGEAIIGDIVVMHGSKIVSDKKEKAQKEKLAIKKILSLVGENELVGLYEEYEKDVTIESKLVKQLDKLEMSFQALDYEMSQNKNLDKFFKNTKLHLTDPLLISTLQEIQKRRP